MAITGPKPLREWKRKVPKPLPSEMGSLSSEEVETEGDWMWKDDSRVKSSTVRSEEGVKEGI